MMHPYLADRGLTASTVQAAGLFVERIPRDSCRTYGLPADAAGLEALVIPYGTFNRLRLLTPDAVKGGKYRQPKGSALGLFDPFGHLVRDDPFDALLIVEGELNALSIAQAMPALPVVGLPGHNALTDDVVETVAHVPCVYLWFDLHEKGARRALNQATRKLRRAGVGDVRIVEPTDSVDANEMLVKSPDRAGLVFRYLVETASPVEPDDDDGKPPAGPRWNWLDLVAMQSTDPKPVRWLIDGLALKGALTMLAGQPGEGKSLLAMATAAGVANGEDVGGIRCRRGSVLIVDAEQSAVEIHRRVRALGVRGQVGIVQVDGVDLERDLEDIRVQVRDHRPDLVVFDSFRSLWTGEENDAAATAAPLYALNRLAQRLGVAVVLLHHAGKGESSPYRGSTAIAGAIEIGLTLARAKDDPDPTRRYLDCWKCRPAPEPKRRWLRIADERARGQVFIEPADPFEGGRTGRPATQRVAVRDEIVRALAAQPAGMTRADLSRALGRSPYDGTVRRVLETLEIAGLVERFADGVGTRFRPLPALLAGEELAGAVIPFGRPANVAVEPNRVVPIFPEER